MESLKARLRAWLIELVREAIRIEREAELHKRAGVPIGAGVKTPSEGAMVGVGTWPRDPEPVGFSKYTVSLKAASKPVTPTMTSEPSFEQMQANSIREQEQYYADKAEPPRSTHA